MSALSSIVFSGGEFERGDLFAVLAFEVSSFEVEDEREVLVGLFLFEVEVEVVSVFEFLF